MPSSVRPVTAGGQMFSTSVYRALERLSGVLQQERDGSDANVEVWWKLEV